jgi:hypothetical protein
VRTLVIAFCFAASVIATPAQTPTRNAVKPKPAAPAVAAVATPPFIKDLPVRKVVLYKNGVGYFEHSGTVTGNQRVAVDFTSAQLNDVLQSLTVLDEGGGRIGGVNYNSTTPLAEQLKSLTLGMGDDPTSTELFQALRGQKVEVTGGPGGVITGRLVSVETHTEKVGSGDSTVVKYYLTMVTASGGVRVIEVTPALSVRPVDANLQGQLDRYLELLSSTRAAGLRHLTLNAMGQGQRDVRVSYISEVPVWKATYRLVFPRDGKGNAVLQGWAVVDNTVGADWDNVQLALVAGAPQSFIQPLSQPLYARRPEIPISTSAMTTPQTHEAANAAAAGSISGTVTDSSGAVIPDATVTATAQGTNAATSRTTSSEGEYTIEPLPPGIYSLTVTANGFNQYVQRGIHVAAQSEATVDVNLQVGSAAQTVTVETDNRAFLAAPRAMKLKAGPPPMPVMESTGMNGSLGGGVYRPTDAIGEGDVSTNAFDDFFEYALAQPVTIHKNESAMVPILQQELPAEHVTLWTERERRPLRAVWLKNDSKLTLDSGSFSIFESGEFAGEGLLDPIHPGERRLLSYATDQAVKVHRAGFADTRTLHHIAMHNGVMVETTSEVTETTYTVANGADEARVVVIEHARRPEAELDSDQKPAETSATAYRFRMTVEPHQSADLRVGEKANLSGTVEINANQFQQEYLVNVSKYTPDLEEKLRPLIAAEQALESLNAQINENEAKEKTLAADEARARENVTALKGNEAARRFVEELNRAEDAIQATRKEHAELVAKRDAARAHLDAEIARVSFETDLSVVTGSTREGNVSKP